MSETIASLVGQCSECPHRRYSGSGKHDCAKVQAPIVDAARIPARDLVRIAAEQLARVE